MTGLTATEESTTSSMIDGTQVLDAATAMPHSKIKDVIEYVLSGLIGGLAIGLGIVIVRELISDRLRRRDDIAAALGGPGPAERRPGGQAQAPARRAVRCGQEARPGADRGPSAQLGATFEAASGHAGSRRRGQRP